MLMALLIGGLTLMGCTNDLMGEDVKNPTTNGIILHFAPPQVENIEVRSRAYNLNYLDENRVLNMFVFLFDSSGDRVYSQYYDNTNLKTSQAQVHSATEDCWFVNNSSSAGTKTAGVVNIHTTVDEEDTYQIYIITNLDADMVDISSDRLSQVQDEQELLNIRGRMIQQTLSRNGALQMSGVLENVKIHKDNNGVVKIFTGNNTNNTATVQLHHMDAKIHITLKQGDKVMSLTNAEIKVVNLPKIGYAFPYEMRVEGATDTTTGHDATTSSEDFFDYGFNSFDEVSQTTASGRTTSTYEAWFYMLENRRSPKVEIPLTNSAVPNYAPFHERSRQTKYQDGTWWLNGIDEDGNRDFMYADNLSTYALIKCSVKTELEGEQAGQELGGDVQYLLHLGNFGKGQTKEQVNNFNVNRNTYYHYTVTINGLNSIAIEVDARGESVDENGRQPSETQPGAFGNIVVATEEIAHCDCHSSSRTITFHAKNISGEKPLTWLVNTPFGEGGPEIDADGNDIIPPGLDYKWVKFRINKMNSNGVYFSDLRREYTNVEYHETNSPDGIMNVSQLVKYIKTQHDLFLEGYDSSKGYSTLGDFDKDPNGPKICVTAFVDEFYYDYDPRDPNAEIPDDFWKWYVNAPQDRYLYILSDAFMSNDKESSSKGSVITIQQRPIQSIYDTNPANTSFHTAWGVEYTDEHSGIWRYDQNAPTTKYEEPNVNPAQNRGNDSQDNGRLNSIKEWNLFTSNTAIKANVKWTDYVNWEVENEVPQLRDGYQKIRYSCMTRNRDNNGNGVIDQDEIRWYTAAIRQLTGMTIGQGLLKFDSRLYHRTSEERMSMDNSVWRQHVVSSTMYGSNSNNPTIVWAEELCSTGDLYNSWRWSNTGGNVGRVYQWTVRCVRNLGTTNETMSTGYDLRQEPDPYVEYDTEKLSITCVRLDEKALRDQSSIDLPFSDENREINRLSKRFYIAPTKVASLPTLPASYNHNMSWVNHNRYISDVGSSVLSGHCPEGYRIPNQNELAMMLLYFPDYVNEGLPFCRTYYSFGVLGEPGVAKEPKAGWGIQGGNIFMVDTHGVGVPRCVRDASVEELEAEGLL